MCCCMVVCGGVCVGVWVCEGVCEYVSGCVCGFGSGCVGLCVGMSVVEWVTDVMMKCGAWMMCELVMLCMLYSDVLVWFILFLIDSITDCTCYSRALWYDHPRV